MERIRAVYMGKDKPSCVEGLRHASDRGLEVVAVVAPGEPGPVPYPERLAEVATGLGLPVVGPEDVYDAVEGRTSPAWWSGDGIDLVISFLYWDRIRPSLIRAARMGCINFHPAPLPDFRGLGGFNVAIVEGLEEWGVSAHFMDEAFDTGDIVRVDRFAIDAGTATALSLDVESQRHLLTVFREVIDEVASGRDLPRTPQGEGRYITGAEAEQMRLIRPDDDPETVHRRIRAFWYPPYPGALIETPAGPLTVIDPERLEDLGRSCTASAWEAF